MTKACAVRSARAVQEPSHIAHNPASLAGLCAVIVVTCQSGGTWLGSFNVVEEAEGSIDVANQDEY